MSPGFEPQLPWDFFNFSCLSNQAKSHAHTHILGIRQVSPLADLRRPFPPIFPRVIAHKHDGGGSAAQDQAGAETPQGIHPGEPRVRDGRVQRGHSALWVIIVPNAQLALANPTRPNSLLHRHRTMTPKQLRTELAEELGVDAGELKQHKELINAVVDKVWGRTDVLQEAAA